MSDRQTPENNKLAKFNEQLAARGLTAQQWDVLRLAIFPNASSVESVLLAVDYCKARGLDIMKKPVHIVPVWSSRHNKMIDTVWPGINEIRTTAMRSRVCAGRDATEFGPDKTATLSGVEVTFPEWAQVTVYRMVDGQRCAFFGPKVFWLEAYATADRKTDAPNAMWKDRPRGQLDKCAEAAAWRCAFPEEIGNDIAVDEINPYREARDVTPQPEPKDRASKKPTKLMLDALYNQLFSRFNGDFDAIAGYLVDQWGIIAKPNEQGVLDALNAIESKGDVDAIAGDLVALATEPEAINDDEIPQ